MTLLLEVAMKLPSTSMFPAAARPSPSQGFWRAELSVLQPHFCTLGNGSFQTFGPAVSSELAEFLKYLGSLLRT